ncbi:MAG: cation:proton antiporter [Candidatus Kariarchaeaceae archaeon]|jgi:CPA1 family monovalent cation:H+ antiporter
MSSQNEIITTVTIVLLMGVLAGIGAEKRKTPKMIPLMVTGIIFSILSSDLIIDLKQEGIKDVTLIIAELGLIIVLFNEGMHLNLRRLFNNAFPVLLLATIGTILTTMFVAILTTFVTSSLLDVDFSYMLLGNLLMASVVVPTDPAATFSVLKSSGGKLKSHLETILGGESAFNDIIAILLVLIIFLPQVEDGNRALSLNISMFGLAMWQLIGGILLGIVISVLVHFMIGKVNSANDTTAIALVGVLLIFIISTTINVSGAIAALCGGVLLKNPNYIKMDVYYQDQFMAAFWEKVVYLIEIFAFIFIGFLFDSSQLRIILTLGVSLTLIIIPVRLASVFLSTWPLTRQEKQKQTLTNTDKFFIAFAGYKGLTTAVLALISYVALSHNPETSGLADALLFGGLGVILVSSSLQTTILRFITKRMPIYET